MQLEELPVLTLSGSAAERGRAHGETLREAVHEVVGDWIYLVEKITGGRVGEVASRFRTDTGFEAAMRRFTPGLVEEIEGIAAGADMPADVLFMFNCTDENQWYLEHLSRGAPLPEGRGCSSFGVRMSEPGCPMVGQNMDIPGATDGFQVLFRIQADGQPDQLVFALAGMLGMMGLSRAPVGVVNNSLRQLDVRADGLPVTAMVRGLLAQPDYAAAQSFIQQTPHATGHNWILGGPEEVSMWECSANQVVRVTHAEAADRLVHTNHALKSEDTYPDPAFMAGRSPSSMARFEAMSQAILDGDELPDLENLKAALSSHTDPENPVCRHVTDRKTNFSAGAVIYELSEAPVLHLAPGPPCETTFGRFQFD